MTLLTDLAQEVHEFGGRRVPVDNWAEFVSHDTPHLKGFLGFHTFTTLGRRPWRYCDSHVVTEVAGQRFEGMSQLELRNPYLRACGHRRSKWSSQDEDAYYEVGGLTVPSYRRKGMPKGAVVGLDMDYSYWQFVRHFTTQVEYRPESGVWAGVGYDWQDWETLRPLKTTRSAIVSSSWSNKYATWTFQSDEHQVRNPFYQPQAVRLLSDYLHSWAQEVWALFDPWAIIVDCAVLDADKAQDFLEFSADRWGLTFHADKSWEPGEQWPWAKGVHARSNLRPIPDKVRQRLAWQLTGQGPMDAPLIAWRDADAQLHTEEPPPPEEPAPAPWQARRGLTAWQLVIVPTLPDPATRKVVQRRSRCAYATWHPGGDVVEVVGPRAPPAAA